MSSAGFDVGAAGSVSGNVADARGCSAAAAPASGAESCDVAYMPAARIGLAARVKRRALRGGAPVRASFRSRAGFGVISVC